MTPSPGRAGERDVHAAELAALEDRWGGAYAVEFYAGVYPEEWVAYRLDGAGGRLAALSADGLGTLISADRAGRAGSAR